MGWCFCLSHLFHFTGAMRLRRADSPADPGKSMGMLLLMQAFLHCGDAGCPFPVESLNLPMI